MTLETKGNNKQITTKNLHCACTVGAHFKKSAGWGSVIPGSPEAQPCKLGWETPVLHEPSAFRTARLKAEVWLGLSVPSASFLAETHRCAGP